MCIWITVPIIHLSQSAHNPSELECAYYPSEPQGAHNPSELECAHYPSESECAHYPHPWQHDQLITDLTERTRAYRNSVEEVTYFATRNRIPPWIQDQMLDHMLKFKDDTPIQSPIAQHLQALPTDLERSSRTLLSPYILQCRFSSRREDTEQCSRGSSEACHHTSSPSAEQRRLFGFRKWKIGHVAELYRQAPWSCKHETMRVPPWCRRGDSTFGVDSHKLCHKRPGSRV
jgi:hypothetical protein